jgi:hypothetical protein
MPQTPAVVAKKGCLKSETVVLRSETLVLKSEIPSVANKGCPSGGYGEQAAEPVLRGRKLKRENKPRTRLIGGV